MPSATTSERPRRIALTAGRLFDGTSDHLQPRPMILIEGATISAVEFGVSVPADCERHDLDGATLLPGLIDPHVHLAFDASATPVANLAERDDDATLAAMTVAARTALHGGVTTVRDLGDRHYLSLALRGRADLPTILCAGPPITTTGGHCHYLGGGIGDGAANAVGAVREHVERGVDVIKIMGSGGNLTPGTFPQCAQFTVSELRAAVDEAHRHGLPVTVHAHAAESIANAMAAGADALEHATFWTEDGVDAPRTLLDEIVARRIVVGATAGMVPPQPGGTGPPAAMLLRMPQILANMRLLLEAGAVIVAGTDAGIAPIKPHDVLRYALPMMQQVGMTPLRALQTVTAGSAAACGLGDSKGRLAAGYDADVLAVDGDPVSDPAAIHRIRSVFARGALVR